jgi:hypothetical protein
LSVISKAERNRRAALAFVGDGQPYPQQYVVTMESGAVYLVSILAANRQAGEAEAKRQALCMKKGGAFWALADYPWNGDRSTFFQGVQIIKAAPRKPARLIVEYRGVTMWRKTSPGYALPWSCNCNGVNLSADTQDGLRGMIRDTLDSDKRMGAM